MFTFYKEELTKEELKKAVGNNINYFEEKIKWLQEKWGHENSDSEELRLISSIIVRKTNPTNFSIIADNLEYFKDSYIKEYKSDNDLKKALKLGCLCGSQKIAEFLLNKLSVNYSTVGYDFVLSSACASNNEEWCKSIAKVMAREKTLMPKGVYAYASSALISEMKKIFNVENPAPFKLRSCS
jgi:hypothetical protein